MPPAHGRSVDGPHNIEEEPCPRLGRLVVDIGVDPATDKRQQARRRFKTVDEATDEYTKIKGEARAGTFVGQSTLTIAQACAEWL